MTATTRPTRFPVLLVVAMLAFTISACGSNPNGPGPIGPSPSPTPAGTWVRMQTVNPTVGSTVPYDTAINVSAMYNVEGHDQQIANLQIMIRACLSADGVTEVYVSGSCSGTFAINPPQMANLRPALNGEEARRLGITRTNFLIVRVAVRGTNEILTQEVYEAPYNFQ